MYPTNRTCKTIIKSLKTDKNVHVNSRIVLSMAIELNNYMHE